MKYRVILIDYDADDDEKSVIVEADMFCVGVDGVLIFQKKVVVNNTMYDPTDGYSTPTYDNFVNSDAFRFWSRVEEVED